MIRHVSVKLVDINIIPIIGYHNKFQFKNEQ